MSKQPQSDVLIENFLPGKAEETFGLGYESLHKINPRLIYCSISGYGPTGPYAARGGYDVIVQGVGGLMSVTGPAGQNNPCKTGTALVDMSAGESAPCVLISGKHPCE